MSSWPGHPRAVSGAPLESLGGGDGEAHGEGVLDVDEAHRYVDSGPLGRGGMGEVRAMVDRRLDREVALKVTHARDALTEARMVREAMLTARLEHPGIVPVYGAGRMPDGRPYYSMRVVRGRSLGEAIKEAPELRDRLRLVRRVLDAVEAVAYAHDQGVLHRDLKPANVMIGEYGQTMVVDWGLATTLGEAGLTALAPELPGPDELEELPSGEVVPWRPELPETNTTWPPLEPSELSPLDTQPMDATLRDRARGALPDGLLTRPGEVFGTPAYMAPEQARGGRTGKGTDVFALGGVLFHVLTGRSPRLSVDPQEPIPPVRTLCPEAPQELAAIVERAMATDPAERYSDAGALAQDLVAWFEGRQVAAYDYSALELLLRAVKAYRLPLAVGAVAMVGLSLAIGVGVWRTVVERNRAVAAESDAVLSRQASDANLQRAMVAQARVAEERGDRATAEVLAAHALRYGEDADARGILVRYGGRERPQLVRSIALPHCAGPIVDATGRRVACLGGGSLRVVTPDLPEAPVLTFDEPVTSLAFAGDSPDVLALAPSGGWTWNLETDARTPLPEVSAMSDLRVTGVDDLALVVVNGRVHYLDPAKGVMRAGRGCPSVTAPLQSVVTAEGLLVYACAARDDGQAIIVAGPVDGELEVLIELSLADGPPTALTVSSDGPQRVAVGTETGVLVVYEEGRGELLRTRSGRPGIGAIALSGDRLALAGSRGGVEVWDLGLAREVANLPSGPAQLRWLDEDPGLLRVVDTQVRDWWVPPNDAPARFDDESGVAAVAVSSDGALIGSCHGDGSLHVVDARSGEERLVARPHTSVAKDLAFSPDGRFVAVGHARLMGLRVYEVATGELVTTLPSNRVRRVAWGEGGLVATTYGMEVRTWADWAGAPFVDWGLTTMGVDLTSVPGRTESLVLDELGRVAGVDPKEAGPRTEGLPSLATARQVSASEDSIFLADLHGVIRYDRAGQETGRIEDLASRIDELKASTDGRWLAIGHRDGAITLWDAASMAPAAVLRGHDARVVALDFAPDGSALVSGSWDGTVRQWALEPLTAPAERLIAPIETAWGLDLAGALEEGRTRVGL